MTNTIADLSLGQQSGSSGATQTAKVAGTNDLEPYFSPTGASLIFTNTDNTGTGQRNVYVSDADGRNRTLLIQQAEMPYWR